MADTGKKVGRNKRTMERYKLSNTLERNKAMRASKTLQHHPHDLSLRAKLREWFPFLRNAERSVVETRLAKVGITLS